MKRAIVLVVTLIGVLTMITAATTQTPFPGVRLVTTSTLRCEAGNVVAAVTVTNQGATTANNVQLTQAALLNPNQTGTPLPQSYGNIALGQSVTHDVSFGVTRRVSVR